MSTYAVAHSFMLRVDACELFDRPDPKTKARPSCDEPGTGERSRAADERPAHLQLTHTRGAIEVEQSGTVFCVGCNESRPAAEVKHYEITDHDGATSEADYCDDCAELAGMDWNGTTTAIREIPTFVSAAPVPAEVRTRLERTLGIRVVAPSRRQAERDIMRFLAGKRDAIPELQMVTGPRRRGMGRAS